jgi:type II secretory pathway component PulC
LKQIILSLLLLGPAPLFAHGAPAKATAPLVTQVSRLKYEVSRSAAEKVLGDGMGQLASFTALPAFDDGPFSGIRVSGFSKKCLLPRFGVQEGDVVAAIQGTRLRGPGDIMEVAKRLEKIRPGNHVRVEIRRDGEPVTQNYLVVD